MTLNALIKELEKLRDKGHGRCKISVDKSSLWDGNGCFDICDIKTADREIINVGEGDGGIAVTSKGVERLVDVIILRGGDR